MGTSIRLSLHFIQRYYLQITELPIQTECIDFVIYRQKIISSAKWLLTYQIEYLKHLEKNIQMLATLVLDIYCVRHRYLSRSSQISVSCELDIIKNCILYTSTLQYLKDIYIDEDYEYFYSAIFRLKYYYRYLINNMFFGILLYKNTFFYNCLPLHRAYIFSSE